MATIEIEATLSPSPTPPPIPSSSHRAPHNGTNYTPPNTHPTGHTPLIDGAPTKESRLLEYFLVISYGRSLKIRHRSPLMDIFDNFKKRVHHHHAYIVQPNLRHRDSKHHRKKRKRHKPKTDQPTETKEPEPKCDLPRSPSGDYPNIEHIRQGSQDFDIHTPLPPHINDNPFGSLRFEPSVIDRFPPLDHQDTAIISTDTQLQYFCLPTGLFLTKFPSLPIFYTFVWTPESGEHLYGCCLRFFEPVEASTIYEFCSNSDTIHPSSTDCNMEHLKYLSLEECTGYFAPKCICIISYHSFIGAYRTFLTELYRISLTPSVVPIERYLCNFFLECPLPPRGYFSVRYNIGDKSFVMVRAPSNNPLSKSSISSRVLFELFTIDVIMRIYKAILLEEKLLFISTQYSILSLITEIFVSLLYPFTWPHVYIPMLPEDFLAFLKAPTVFIIGTHKSLLLQIGDELEDDILVVDINDGTISNGYRMDRNMRAHTATASVSYANSSMNIELPKHETLKLIKFLEPVSNLLHGSRQHDFHQLDLAFPVAPTPDMIEKQEQLQAQRLNKMKYLSKRRKNSDSLQGITTAVPGISEHDPESVSDPKPDKKPKRSFSLSFKKFKQKRKLSKKMSLNSIGMNFRGRSDSIEPPIKTYTTSPDKKGIQLASHTEPRPIHSSQSEVVVKSLKSQHEGTLQDIVESPINAVFDDAAVRNGFLRFWLSIFRSYQECLIHPNGHPHHQHLNTLSIGPLNEPIYEDSATTTLDKKSLNMNHSEDEGSKKKEELSKSKSGSSRSMTSSVNTTGSGTPSAAPLVMGQSENAIFDEDKFLKSSPTQSRPFLSIFLTTEAFNRFITTCVFEADTNPDVRYFNEKIIQKLGRSRFTKAQPTPFLNNRDYVLNHEFTVPSPDISDLLESNRKFIYPEWPKLDHGLYTKARKKYPVISNARDAASSKSDITSNYGNMNGSMNDELSITFEPSKSQTITSTIISPPRGALHHTHTITPQTQTHNNEREKEDYNIIRENDEDGKEDDDMVVLQLGDFNGSKEDNPFSHDRVTYHLWFYIFIRTLQPGNGTDTESQQRALHLMIKIMAQMKNESVGLPDKWVFTEIIDAMSRMSWGDHVLKLVQVMHELQYELDATIYSALLNVLTKHNGGDLEKAYNILGNLPTSDATATAQPIMVNHGDRHRNSLLMNCHVKPKQKRRKYYETIKELQNRFKDTFPGRSIIVKQACPFCEEAIHDVHIRMGWSRNDQSLDTQCPSCHKRFGAMFVIPESEEYRVWFHSPDSVECLKFFRMRSDHGTFVKNIDFNEVNHLNEERQNAIANMIAIGDQIIAINAVDVSHKSLNEILELLKNPPPPNEDMAEMQEHSVSDAQSTDMDHESKDHNNNNNNESHAYGGVGRLKKISTTSKLMAFIKMNTSSTKKLAPICITFRRAVLCPYFSPLILYREIKKVIQNHAMHQNENGNASGSGAGVDSSYRKKKENIKVLLQQTGIAAISSVEFRVQHCELFWNLAWHFTNLRLPISFLRNAFQDKKQINTPQIDDLIDFIPLPAV